MMDRRRRPIHHPSATTNEKKKVSTSHPNTRTNIIVHTNTGAVLLVSTYSYHILRKAKRILMMVQHPSKHIIASLVLALLATTSSAFTTPHPYYGAAVSVGISGTSPLLISSTGKNHHHAAVYYNNNNKKQQTRLIQMSDTSADGGSMEKKKGFIGRVRRR